MQTYDSTTAIQGVAAQGADTRRCVLAYHGTNPQAGNFFCQPLDKALAILASVDGACSCTLCQCQY
jgi:hypothetical protein